MHDAAQSYCAQQVSPRLPEPPHCLAAEAEAFIGAGKATAVSLASTSLEERANETPSCSSSLGMLSYSDPGSPTTIAAPDLRVSALGAARLDDEPFVLGQSMSGCWVTEAPEPPVPEKRTQGRSNAKAGFLAQNPQLPFLVAELLCWAALCGVDLSSAWWTHVAWAGRVSVVSRSISVATLCASALAVLFGLFRPPGSCFKACRVPPATQSLLAGAAVWLIYHAVGCRTAPAGAGAAALAVLVGLAAAGALRVRSSAARDVLPKGDQVSKWLPEEHADEVVIRVPAVFRSSKGRWKPLFKDVGKEAKKKLSTQLNKGEEGEFGRQVPCIYNLRRVSVTSTRSTGSANSDAGREPSFSVEKILANLPPEFRSKMMACSSTTAPPESDSDEGSALSDISDADSLGV